MDWVRNAIIAVIIVVLGGSAVASAAPLLPVAIVTTSANDADVTLVRWRGRGDGGAGVAAGLATGLIIGGLLAAPRYYYEPYPYPYGYYAPQYVGPIGYGPPGWEAHCFSRYRSFDPISGTYLSRNGRRYYCR